MLEDPLFWVLVLPGLLLGTYAQWRIKANVAEYSQVRTDNGITGAEVARRLLDSAGSSRRKGRGHAWHADGPLRSPIENPAAKPGRLLHTKRGGSGNCCP